MNENINNESKKIKVAYYSMGAFAILASGSILSIILLIVLSDISTPYSSLMCDSISPVIMPFAFMEIIFRSISSSSIRLCLITSFGSYSPCLSLGIFTSTSPYPFLLLSVSLFLPSFLHIQVRPLAHPQGFH